MSIKRLLLPSILGLSLAGSGVALAQPQAMQAKPCDKASAKCPQKSHQSSKQREQARAIMQQYRMQIRPMRHKAKVLKIQIHGKMVTEGTTWKDIAMMNEELNQLRANISTLRLKARLDVFQKTGVLLPSKGKGRKFRHGQWRKHSN